MSANRSNEAKRATFSYGSHELVWYTNVIVTGDGPDRLALSTQLLITSSHPGPRLHWSNLVNKETKTLQSRE